MNDAAQLRTNLATWAVPVNTMPAVSAAMLKTLPRETWDKNFLGQFLQTTYYDTPSFYLRKARLKGEKYLTLRLRCYPNMNYAFSAKTESEKTRIAISQATAIQIAKSPSEIAALLPANLKARLNELAEEEKDSLAAITTITCFRYAVEDEMDRITLDTEVQTLYGKILPYGILEFKSTITGALPPDNLADLPLAKIKLSKFLWGTQVL